MHFAVAALDCSSPATVQPGLYQAMACHQTLPLACSGMGLARETIGPLHIKIFVQLQLPVGQL